jgi:hypothetical protein
MPDLRNKPGDAVKIAGTYVLTSRNGECLGIAVWREVGERLPIAVAAEGPVRYVLVANATETAQAA